ncbi:myelin-oligodendrocyte glycoprotein-like isoform X2 [Centroberyx gerrardi]
MHFEEFGRSFSHRIFTARFTFVVAFFLLNTPAEVFPGQSEVIGSPQPIVAVVGDDVILPCHVEPRLNVEDLTVEWTRPDLRAEYVHLYRDGREMLAMKNPLYSGRTVLFRDGLKHGDISLKLTNVTLADEGKYRCFIPKLNGRKKVSVVQLVVERLPQNTNNGTTEKPQQPGDPHQKEEEEVEGEPSKRSPLIPTVIGLSVISLTLICGGFTYLLIRFFKQKRQGDTYNMIGAHPKQNGDEVGVLAA